MHYYLVATLQGKIKNHALMKKLVFYPNVFQTYPFSMELFIHAEQQERKKQAEAKLQKVEKKRKFKLAFGL